MRAWGIAGLALALGLSVQAQDAPAIDFARDIRPILRDHCLSCHAAAKNKGQLRHDRRSAAFKGGTNAKATVPGQGERWGRHFMDVWRYSDWYGWKAEVRNSQPHIWRWRDWIVESLNGDKPYDRMIVEMLAGDEVAPEDPQTLRATGFLVRNWN